MSSSAKVYEKETTETSEERIAEVLFVVGGPIFAVQQQRQPQ